jgi:hypothetical protein
LSEPRKKRRPGSPEDRFQADAGIDPAIRKRLLRREPSISFRPAAGIIQHGTQDLEVLRIAAEDGRVLVSGDLRTMSVHFHGFVAMRESAGGLLIPSSRSIEAAIKGLRFVWLTWTPDDLRNRVRSLP